MTVIALSSLLYHQLEGRAPAASSPAATVPASQGNTDATTAQTAWTVQMKEIAVSFSSTAPDAPRPPSSFSQYQAPVAFQSICSD